SGHPPEALEAPSLNEGQKDISILFVDDYPALLDIGKIYLERQAGITVTTALSGPEGLRLLETGSFDAIVSDYQMPEMNGIEFLKAVRTRSRSLPFIIFTGKGREEVVIEALNCGADHYIQKGGEPRSQYAELGHHVRCAVQQRRSEAALQRKHAILRAILAASPNGIAYVKNRTFQWANDSLADMLGYDRDELKGMHLETLYENQEVYDEIGNRIQQELKGNGKATITTRFRHKNGFAIDTEIHIAPLDTGNLHFGHMILMKEMSGKVAAAKAALGPAGLPHLELTPVIEGSPGGKITYYNDAAIDTLARFGSRGSLEEFFPPDLPEILLRMDEKDVGSISRDVMIGTALFREHITLSPQFRIARISAVLIS
ncbi:response regulator, partial [Methanoregula sp.]|uniref:response regulator n=1 Tax=Methanoregula sp. TaxID=2052170 RepID=UPI000CAF534A